MNSSTSYLMSMLCKSSTNKYMIMVKLVIDKIMKNMIKLFFFKSIFKIQGIKQYFITGLRLVDHKFGIKVCIDNLTAYLDIV